MNESPVKGRRSVMPELNAAINEVRWALQKAINLRSSKSIVLKIEGSQKMLLSAREELLEYAQPYNELEQETK